MRFKTFITVLLVCILVYGHAYAEGPNFILKGKNVLEDGIIYYLQRIYNGIPVYDEGVYLTIDRNGELIYLSDSFGDGDFAESKNIVSLQDALGNIHDSVLKSWYIKEKDGYVRVLKPTEFVVDASTGKVIDLEDEGYEIEGNSALDWGDTDMTLNKMEALLEQDGYTYTQKTYSEFNGSRNTNYITGNKNLVI
jgi:Fungalysin/Thermolysin Propeptide Motif.